MVTILIQCTLAVNLRGLSSNGRIRCSTAVFLNHPWYNSKQNKLEVIEDCHRYVTSQYNNLATQTSRVTISFEGGHLFMHTNRRLLRNSKTMSIDLISAAKLINIHTHQIMESYKLTNKQSSTELLIILYIQNKSTLLHNFSTKKQTHTFPFQCIAIIISAEIHAFLTE